MPFPTEVYTHILGFLEEEHLLVDVARVSKAFQRLAYHTVLLSKRDCQEPYGVSVSDHCSPVLTVLLSATFPIELPQLCYSFSFLRTDHRLQNEVNRLRTALRRRVEMGDRIGELVLDFSRVNQALLFQSETPDDEQQHRHLEALQAIHRLFDDATRVCDTFTVTCTSTDDSTSATTILVTKPPEGELRQLHGPRAAITYLRTLMAQCIPQLLPIRDQFHSIHLPSAPPQQLSKAYPPIASTLKIQSTAMLFTSPLFRWTQDMLRSPTVHALALHDIELLQQWRMIIPSLNLGITANLRELIIEGCDIRFQEICTLLRRCTGALRSVVIVPSSTPLLELTSGQQLSAPSATFLRLPLPWLQDVFVPASNFGQDLSALGINLGSAPKDHIPLQELNNRLRFPLLQEISVAIHVPSTRYNVAASPINMPEISQTIGSIMASFHGDDKPTFSLRISLEAPDDVSFVFPTSSSSPASPRLGASSDHARLGRPKTARTRQRRLHLLPSLSPPMLPLNTVPLSPASMSSSLGLGMTGFGSTTSDAMPSITLSPPFLTASPPQSHQTIAHTLSSHASTEFSYPPTISGSQSFLLSSSFEPHRSQHVFGNDLRNLRFIRHLIVRTNLYSLPDWIWEGHDGFVVWVGRYFGSGNFLDEEGLQRVSFVEWGFRDHPTLGELETQLKAKAAEGARTSAAISETMVSTSGPAGDASPRRPSTLLHLNSHPSSNLLMDARQRAPFVAQLRAACGALKTVRIGDVEKNMYAWEAVHASSSS
ncbi:hypothetical protein BDV98DRAFT_558604 [Pterulicium gracile]|uniref:F-box domain-containing protein n=1 Tax=Pterulicium gracile TaxID=1884261 RepID=A0A5C3R0Y3_9AGAR|nr:hypothetical protein BDV98DRAFT_558604 [Pterula gracilis]